MGAGGIDHDTEVGMGIRRKKGDNPAAKAIAPVINFDQSYATKESAIDALNSDILAAKDAGNPAWEYGGITVQRTEGDKSLYYNSYIATSESPTGISWNMTRVREINNLTPVIALDHYHPLTVNAEPKAFSDEDTKAFKIFKSKYTPQIEGVYLVDKYGMRVYRGEGSFRGKSCPTGAASCQ
jgi:hypothetical protein